MITLNNTQLSVLDQMSEYAEVLNSTRRAEEIEVLSPDAPNILLLPAPRNQQDSPETFSQTAFNVSDFKASLDDAEDADFTEVVDALNDMEKGVENGFDSLSSSLSLAALKQNTIDMKQENLLASINAVMLRTEKRELRKLLKPEAFNKEKSSLGTSLATFPGGGPDGNGDDSSGGLDFAMNPFGGGGKDSDSKNNKKGKTKTPGKFAKYVSKLGPIGKVAGLFMAGVATASVAKYIASDPSPEEEKKEAEAKLVEEKKEESSEVRNIERSVFENINSNISTTQAAQIQAHKPTDVLGSADDSMSKTEIGATSIAALSALMLAKGAKIQGVENIPEHSTRTPKLLDKTPKLAPKDVKMPKTTGAPGKGLLGRLGGPAISALFAAKEGYDIYNDNTMSTKDKTVQYSGIAGGLGGAGLGAAALGKLGLVMGGPIGAAIGGVIGGAGGYFLGEKGVESVTNTVYDGVSSIGNFFGFGDDKNDVPEVQQNIEAGQVGKAKDVEEKEQSMFSKMAKLGVLGPVAQLASSMFGSSDKEKDTQAGDGKPFELPSILNRIPGVGLASLAYDAFNEPKAPDIQSNINATAPNSVPKDKAEVADKARQRAKDIAKARTKNTKALNLVKNSSASLSSSVTKLNSSFIESSNSSTKDIVENQSNINNEVVAVPQVDTSPRSSAYDNRQTVHVTTDIDKSVTAKQTSPVPPKAKKEPTTRVIKQVVQPAPSLKDVPVILNEGGLTLINLGYV